METCIGDIVKCQWLDAHANAKEEMSQDEVDKMGSYKFDTYGILARDDRNKLDVKDPLVAVAAEVGEDGRYRGVTYIPSSLVISVKRVKAGRRSVHQKKTVPALTTQSVSDTPST